jgi:predicted GNAT family acetyltransferase
MSSNYDLAFKDYADAAAMCGRLVNEDARDTKWLERLARIYRRFESVLERAARERSEPLDKAVEQYRNEVMARERLVERDKASAPWKQQLQESKERLQNAMASVAPASNKPIPADQPPQQ